MNLNRFFSGLTLMLLLAIGLISYGCTQDEDMAQAKNETEEIDFRGFGDDGEHRCFSVVFPVTLEFPDGSTVEVQSKEEFKAAVRAYHEANPGERFRPIIQFPFDVELASGEIVTLENRRQLRRLLRNCIKDNLPDRPKCFSVVFPVTLEFPDGSTVEVQNKQEMKAAVRAYRQDNPGEPFRPKFQFPYQVELENGDIITLENADQWRRLLKSCVKDNVPDRARCYELVFPVTLEFPDGSTVEVQNKEELKRAIHAWKKDNRGHSTRPQIQFPYDVILKNGDQVTIENLEDQQELKQNCRRHRRHDIQKSDFKASNN